MTRIRRRSLTRIAAPSLRIPFSPAPLCRTAAECSLLTGKVEAQEEICRRPHSAAPLRSVPRARRAMTGGPPPHSAAPLRSVPRARRAPSEMSPRRPQGKRRETFYQPSPGDTSESIRVTARAGPPAPQGRSKVPNPLRPPPRLPSPRPPPPACRNSRCIPTRACAPRSPFPGRIPAGAGRPPARAGAGRRRARSRAADSPPSPRRAARGGGPGSESTPRARRELPPPGRIAAADALARRLRPQRHAARAARIPGRPWPDP